MIKILKMTHSTQKVSEHEWTALMRVMDIASEHRKLRMQVEEVLSLEEEKKQITQRVLSAAEVTGEALTQKDVDNAVAYFYSTRYTFTPPKNTWGYRLAVQYVKAAPLLQRYRFLVLGGALLLAGVYLYSCVSRSSHISTARQISASLEALNSEIKEVSKEKKPIDYAKSIYSTVSRQLVECIDAHKCNEDIIAAARSKLIQLEKVHTALSHPAKILLSTSQSAPTGFNRNFSGQNQRTVHSGHYLIVNAQTLDGNPLELPVLNFETGKMHYVSQWAEQVSESVFNQVRYDKQDDGIIDNVEYAIKPAGHLSLQIQMKNSSGEPVKRLRQITQW